MSRPVIMWFRQDLRTLDHAALNAAAAAGEVICLYVLDDETPGQWRWGRASRWWLHCSLQSLSENLKLVLRRGRADAAIAEVIKESGTGAVYFTRDYAPWSQALERVVKDTCESAGATCHRFGGYLLHEPESIRNGSGEPYKVYAPFSRACFTKGEPRLPAVAEKPVMWQGDVSSEDLRDWQLLPKHPDWSKGFEPGWQPGEKGARVALSRFIEHGLAHYAEGRDRPDQSFTSRLSPHLHWGEISPAQCWVAVLGAMAQARGKLDVAGEKYLKEILWREFSYSILHHWPNLPESPFRQEFSAFPSRNDPDALKKWQQGMTGYPIVDAGMRELWATGTMHNRVRMIAASFLTKDLLVPWMEGAKWFWDTLVDADIASNSASWQWVAGCGADAAPYFRIFNPVLQGEKFDPDGAYVRRWVPELRYFPANLIHRPWEAHHIQSNYPIPMIDHGFARNRALAALKQLKIAAV
jgi:deoxyribodipyrimidine photo-lyase